MMKKLMMCGLVFCVMSGCATNQGAGAGIGAVTGALVGSQFGGSGEGKVLAMLAGAVAGGFIGSSIGKKLDERDKALLAKTSRDALESTPSGQAVEWRNPDSGHYGYVTPTKTYKDRDHNRYCREYTQEVYVGGKQEMAYGRACRKPDGQWEITQ